jgi:hypothetical protein
VEQKRVEGLLADWARIVAGWSMRVCPCKHSPGEDPRSLWQKAAKLRPPCALVPAAPCPPVYRQRPTCPPRLACRVWAGDGGISAARRGRAS